MSLLKALNFTLHPQHSYAERWREMGVDMAAECSAPLIRLEEGRGEAEIIRELVELLLTARQGGYDAILVGGLSNVMAYAWLIANELELRVIMARTPRLRTPDGKFVFRLDGWFELMSPVDVLLAMGLPLDMDLRSKSSGFGEFKAIVDAYRGG